MRYALMPRLLSRLLLLGLLSAAAGPSGGCQDSTDLPPIKRPPLSRPGAGGRPVLLVTLTPRGLLESPTSEEEETARTMAALDLSLRDSVAQLRVYLDSPLVLVRRQAIRLLSESAHPEAPMALLAALSDPHPDLRDLAGVAISGLPSDRQDTLFARAVRGPDARAGRGAAARWVSLVRENVAEQLTSLLKEPGGAAIRAWLFGPGCRSLPDSVLAAGKAHESAGVRGAAELCALERLEASSPGQARGIPPVAAEALGGESAVRELVAGQLRRLAHCATPKDAAVLLPALDASSRTLSRQASIAVAGAQAAFGDGRGLDTLCLLLRAGDGDTAMAALTILDELGAVLGRVAHPRLGEALSPWLADRDQRLRRLAATVAGMSGDGELVPELVKRMRDSDEGVRFAAAYGLGRLGARPAVGVLVEVGIDDASESVRDASFVALHHLVHDWPMPPEPLASEWLDAAPAGAEGRFFGRDHERWRRWYQLER